LVIDVLREYGLQSDEATDGDLSDIERYYINNNGFFEVVEVHGKIVATVGLSKVDESTCELRKMYMLPAYRGKGLGKQLLEMALTKARSLGYRRVTLETATPLKEAIGLYRKYGFKPVEACHLSPRCDQRYELNL
jgi:putative acetyltransferase